MKIYIEGNVYGTPVPPGMCAPMGKERVAVDELVGWSERGGDYISPHDPPRHKRKGFFNANLVIVHGSVEYHKNLSGYYFPFKDGGEKIQKFLASLRGKELHLRQYRNFPGEWGAWDVEGNLVFPIVEGAKASSNLVLLV